MPPLIFYNFMYNLHIQYVHACKRFILFTLNFLETLKRFVINCLYYLYVKCSSVYDEPIIFFLFLVCTQKMLLNLSAVHAKVYTYFLNKMKVYVID